MRRDAVPAGMVLGQVNIEDLFVFMAKGCEMKGLFYKEAARCLWQYGKSYILLVVIFFWASTFLNKGGGGELWLLYPVFFVGSLPASLLSADRGTAGWPIVIRCR